MPVPDECALCWYVAGACNTGARWMRAAIRKDDNALSFELRNVSTGTGDWVTAIYIGGVLRTEVDLSKLFLDVGP